jgi:hypothetical protein
MATDSSLMPMSMVSKIDVVDRHCRRAAGNRAADRTRSTSMRSLRMAALALTLAPSLMAAQTADDPLLVQLAGAWSGQGMVLGMPARLEMEWTWTLNRQFLRLTFRNVMGDAPKSRVFEGHAYYRAMGGGRYRGTWFDNSGAIRPIEARAEGNAIVAEWGTPETELGETTYRLQTPDRMDVTDRVRQKDGAWRPFGQSALTRKP